MRVSRHPAWPEQARRFAFLKVSALGCLDDLVLTFVRCAIEGKERWPGVFPEDASDCAKELSVTTEGGEEVGSPNGLYTVRFGENQNVFSGTGWVVIPWRRPTNGTDCRCCQSRWMTMSHSGEGRSKDRFSIV